MRSHVLAAIAAVLVLVTAGYGQEQGSSQIAPRWSHTFSANPWVVNASLTPEYGIPTDDGRRRNDLATIDSVDTFHSTMVVVEGPPEDAAVVRALDAESGSTLWQKAGIRLNRWRPFPSYVPADARRAYYSQIVDSTVLLWLTGAKRAGFDRCSDGRELVALDLKDGRFLWCNHELGEGDVTFVAVPERKAVLAWFATDAGVSLLSIDVMTGLTRWRHALNVKGQEWLRMISFLTGLPAPDSARPPLQHDGFVCVVIGEAKRYGPVMRPPAEATIQILDTDSGRLLWQTKQALNGRKSWLSWTFSSRSLIVTTGQAVHAYSLNSGDRLWSTTLEDVRSLRVPRGVQRELVLVDFGARNWSQPTPAKRGHGLAALDVATGELLWHDANARTLHSLDEAGRAVFVEGGKEVRVLDAMSGRDIARLNPEFRNQVRYGRLLDTDKVMVQSVNEIAAYRLGVSRPLYQQTVSAAVRGPSADWLIVGGAFIAGFAVAGPVGGAAALLIPTSSRGSAGTRKSPMPETMSQYAFFATGRGGHSQLVAVAVGDGAQKVVAPFIWTDRGSLYTSLGNLLDEPHGTVYTLSDNTLAAYAFNVDEAAHRTLHRLADLRRAVDVRDRAMGMAAARQTETAQREAFIAVPALEAFTRRTDASAIEVLIAQRGLSDSLAVLADAAEGSHKTAQTARALEAYERTLNLLRQSSEVELGDWRTDIAERIDRLRGAAETK